jgi:hypothetical protein
VTGGGGLAEVVSGEAGSCQGRKVGSGTREKWGGANAPYTAPLRFTSRTTRFGSCDEGNVSRRKGGRGKTTHLRLFLEGSVEVDVRQSYPRVGDDDVDLAVGAVGAALLKGRSGSEREKKRGRRSRRTKRETWSLQLVTSQTL